MTELRYLINITAASRSICTSQIFNTGRRPLLSGVGDECGK